MNAEGVLTALLAWFVFRENFDRRVALGMVLIVAGAIVLSYQSDAGFGVALPKLAILGACFAWATDNNLTRKVSLVDATFVAMVKGLTAGVVNTGLALLGGGILPGMKFLIAAGTIGFLSYGISLALFVVALRHLGTARTGAYFSTAPFAGAFIAIPLLSEPVTLQLKLAGVLMGAGVWLHLTERHDHGHTHASLAHEHVHEHDAHHQHPHTEEQSADIPHQHSHVHEPSTHSHPHFPDAHHRHRH